MNGCHGYLVRGVSWGCNQGVRAKPFINNFSGEETKIKIFLYLDKELPILIDTGTGDYIRTHGDSLGFIKIMQDVFLPTPTALAGPFTGIMFLTLSFLKKLPVMLRQMEGNHKELVGELHQ